MNDGITACVAVLRNVFEHLEGKNVKLLHMDNEDLVEAIKPYATILGKYLGGLSMEHRKGFRDLRGVQGQTARKYRCQQAIQEKMREFNPPGLNEFLEREKEQTNLRAKEILDQIEKTLQRVILEELKREYGESENEWWLLGVPKKVRVEVGQRFENDDGKRATKEAYFELIDYRRIALERWDIFGTIFGYGTSGNKEKKTKWMVDINEMRNLVSHPSSGATLSVEQVAEIEQRQRWLEGQIAGMARDQTEDNSTDQAEEGSGDSDADLPA
jgi:hypothetical protein